MCKGTETDSLEPEKKHSNDCDAGNRSGATINTLALAISITGIILMIVTLQYVSSWTVATFGNYPGSHIVRPVISGAICGIFGVRVFEVSKRSIGKCLKRLKR